MAFTPIKCYGNYHRFCFLQKFNNRSRNNESHEKLPPAKSVMAWLILHFPGTYWNFYFAKAKLHHDGAVTFTGSVTSWKIEYYGKVTFASSRGCCCVISFEQQKNDGAFLAKFKKCYESRSQYEGGNCCCILSQKCKFTFDLLISQSLSMFWRCSRAATIAVGWRPLPIFLRGSGIFAVHKFLQYALQVTSFFSWFWRGSICFESCDS